MRNDEFDKMVTGFRSQQDNLILRKGHDYTTGHGTEDRLYNFKWVGEMLDISPLKVAGIYWLKHVLAITTYIKYGGVLSDESIDSRLLDESNYNLLITAIIDEARCNATEGPAARALREVREYNDPQQVRHGHPVRNPDKRADTDKGGMPKNPEMPNPYDNLIRGRE